MTMSVPPDLNDLDLVLFPFALVLGHNDNVCVAALAETFDWIVENALQQETNFNDTSCQSCGSGSGFKYLWIRTRNSDPGSGSKGNKRKKKMYF
jgi:hypothetical protein